MTKLSPKPVVIIKPDTQVFRGERVTFRCNIQTGGDTEWTYEWNRDGHTFSPYNTAQEFTDSYHYSRGKYTCRGRRRDSQLSQISHPVTLSVSEKPKAVITSSPKGDVLTGNSVTLTCRLNVQSAGWKFYWNTSTQSTETETAAQYSYSSSYSHHYIRSVSVSDRGQYRCRAGRGTPVYYTQYSDALWVNVIEIKPVVIMKPDTQVFSGERVTFRCNIQTGDTEWTYSWYRDGHTFYPYSTAQEFTDYYYSSGKYTCRGRRRDSQLSQISDPVTLSISEKPKPELTSSPEGDILTGNSVTLTCRLNVQSDGWKFYWITLTQSTETETAAQYYYSSYYSYYSYSHNTIRSVSVSDGGQYRCRAGRGTPVYYTQYSDALWVNVIVSPKPVVIINPDIQVYRGERVTFRCDVQTGGDTEWTYSWYKNNNTQLRDTTQELIISSVRDSDGGKYTCRGRKRDSQLSQISHPVTLSVSEKPKPELNSDLKGAALMVNPVILSCTLKPQSAGWKFYWIKDTESNETETETFYYFIRSVSVSDGGQYRCRAGRGNPVYYTHYSDALWVNVTASPKPVVNVETKLPVYRGESVTLRCDIKGGGNTVWTYEWFMDDTPVSPSHTTQRITVVSDDGGKYTCRGKRSDSQLSQKSDPPSLPVSEKPKPVITSSPEGDVLTGTSVTLTCTLDVQSDGWKFYWNTSAQSTDTMPETNSYTIRSVSGSNRGGYQCRAGRGNPVYYTHYSNALQLDVTENTKPELTSGLIGAALSGNPVTLTCRLDLQSDGWKIYWTTPTQRTGTGTETQYSSSSYYSYYTISSVSVSDGGQYKCRAGRGTPVYYTLYSDDLPLSVTEIKPVVIINPDTQVYRGERVTFRCNIQTGGDTEWTYSWYKNENTQTPHRTTQEFTVDITGQGWRSYGGKYTCRGTRRSDSQISEMSDAVPFSVSEKPKPDLTSDPNGETPTGNPVTLTCTLKPQSVGWKFYWITPTQSNETETKTHSYTITPVSVSDEGQYRCRAGRGDPVYYTHYSDALWVNVTGKSPPVSLNILPSRTQHFTADSLSLSCEDQRYSTGWTVRGNTLNKTEFNCSSVSESICHISSLSTSHTGVYWCQSESGGRSNSLNITVHNGDVILKSPVHPVTEGNPLTLRCSYRNTKISDSGADFYKDGSVLQKQTTGEMTISSVSMSDEGFYHCKHPKRGESPKSWVSVRGESHGKAPQSVLKLLSSVVAASPYVLVTIILAVKCYRARTEPEEDTRPDRVIEAEVAS
ncbi:Fc receptor-like protein 5 [Clarias gariepinus]|uniref:Fc receptor-like protein 5 n=1 Tax=Clarias gariepinus TaxID=13013 RepID=UPI00234D5CD0|nr:Fc receptor-like protein 5 [Clarias gariepinus]